MGGLCVEGCLGLAYLLTWLSGTMYASAAYFVQREIMPGQEGAFLGRLVVMQTVAGILCKSGVGSLVDGPLDVDFLVRKGFFGTRFVAVHCGALFLGIAPGNLVIAWSKSETAFLAGVFLVEFGLACAWPVFTRAVAEYGEIRRQEIVGSNEATRLFWVLGVASRCGATLAGALCAALADLFSRVSLVKRLARDGKVWRVAASVTLLTCVKMYCQGLLLPAYLDHGTRAAATSRSSTEEVVGAAAGGSATESGSGSAFLLSSVFTFGVTLGVLVAGWCFSVAAPPGQVRLLQGTSLLSVAALLLLALHARLFLRGGASWGVRGDEDVLGNATSVLVPEGSATAVEAAATLFAFEEPQLTHLLHDPGDAGARTAKPSPLAAGKGVGGAAASVPSREGPRLPARRAPAHRWQTYQSAAGETSDARRQLLKSLSAILCFLCAGVGVGLAFYQPPGVFAVQHGRDASSTLSAFVDGVAMLGTLGLTPCCAAVQSRLGFVALFLLLAGLLAIGTSLAVRYYRELCGESETEEKNAVLRT
eukprot:g18396.t1